MDDSKGQTGGESVTPSSKVPPARQGKRVVSVSGSLSLVSDLQKAFDVSEEDALLIAEDPKFAKEALLLQQSSSDSLSQAQKALDELSRLRGLSVHISDTALAGDVSEGKIENLEPPSASPPQDKDDNPE